MQFLAPSLPALPFRLLHLPLKVLIHALVGVLPFVPHQLLNQRPSLEGLFLDINIERLLGVKLLNFDLALRRI